MHQNKRIIMWLRHEYGEGNDNVKTVIEALEKQIPKKPNRHKEDNVIGEYYSCPNCLNNELSDCYDQYCCTCGQLLDWSE